MTSTALISTHYHCMAEVMLRQGCMAYERQGIKACFYCDGQVLPRRMR